MEWWHTIELPDGTVTSGRHDYRTEGGKRYLLPEDLTGKRVLDFGTYDGFWAIEAKKRGANYVVAADRFDPAIETAKLALGAYDIPYACSGDMDFPLPGDFCRGFDVVLFYGILYHLKNPFMGLWTAAGCCKPGGLVIVESAVNQGKIAGINADFPLMWVTDLSYDKDTWPDISNYYIPNEAAVAQLCKMAGLIPIESAWSSCKTRFTLKCQKPMVS